MDHTRRGLLKTTGLALTTAALAGCNGSQTGDSSASTTDGGGESTAAADDARATATTAFAAELTVTSARLHDALALVEAGRDAAAAAVVAGVRSGFENAAGEWSAAAQLRSSHPDVASVFASNLEQAHAALSGEEGGASDALVSAVRNLRSVRDDRAAADAADALSLVTFAARARDVGALAAGGEGEAAAAVGEVTYEAFENDDAHDALESAGESYYEGFEGALETAVEAARNGERESTRSLAGNAASNAVDAAYELAAADVAGVAHLALLQAAGFDAATVARLALNVGYAHAAGLNAYRVRVRDARTLFQAGETAAATSVAQSIFEHFEGARAHEALEEANHDAYERFEHAGLESLVTAIEEGDAEAVDSAVETVHEGLTAGIESLAGGDAAVLESGFFRARLGDAREAYRRGDAASAAAIARGLFARFEADEAGFHETLESTSDDLYETFEHDHLEALVEALEADDASAVETHLSGAQDALERFEATLGVTVASGAAATYLTGRAFDAGVCATLGDADRGATIAQSAFGYFEAGAGGFHEAVEEASEERYHAFEEALGAVNAAATNGDDVSAAAETFAAESLAAVYAVVERAGGDSAAAASVARGIFRTFESARVHEALEEANHDAYEGFESALSSYVEALESGEGVESAAVAYADATRTAQFAVAGAVSNAPAAKAPTGADEEDHGGGGDVTGGPNVVEGVPEDADHVVDMTAVAFEPAEVTVSVGDTVAFEHVGGEAHTVTAYEGKLPEGASYWASGGFDSEAAAREGWASERRGGVTGDRAYVHTFETPGTHAYCCLPHEMAGMTGRIVVEE